MTDLLASSTYFMGLSKEETIYGKVYDKVQNQPVALAFAQ